MNKKIIFLVVLTLAMSSNSITSGAEEASQNLIIKEMAAVDKAFKTAIDAAVLNQLDKIPPAFEEVRKVREEIKKSVKEGKKIMLPKNQERFRLFVSLDNRFHRETEILIESAKKNHMGRVQKQTNRLLGLCIRCHAAFRK